MDVDTNADSGSSSYLSVHAGSGSNVRYMSRAHRMSSEMNGYSPFETRKRIFNETNRISKGEKKEQTMDFKAEMMVMVQRNTQLINVNRNQNRANEMQAKEIQRLKCKIEKSEKELLETKIKLAKQDEKHKNEYKKLSREILVSKREMKKLRGQITELEKEKEQQIRTEKDKKIDLSAYLRTFVKNTEAKMTALRKDLMEKMDETEKNSQKMIHKGFQRLENIIIHGQNGPDGEKERNHSLGQKQNTIPPITSN